MHQPELDAPASHGTGRDSFAEVRAEQPNACLMRFHDRGLGLSYVMAVPPNSHWHALLPAQQDIHVTRQDAGDGPRE